MTRRATTIYTITVAAGSENSIHRLRAALKGLRSLGLRALSVTETLTTGARRQQSKQRERLGDTKMQMKKFAGEMFLKVADVKDGPIREIIEGAREGK